MSPSACPECEGTRYVEEGCDCYQCEYDDSAHRHLVPCLACPEGLAIAEMAELRAEHPDLAEPK